MQRDSLLNKGDFYFNREEINNCNNRMDIHTIIKTCVEQLHEIHTLTLQIAESAQSDHLDSIETIFINRSEAVEKLHDIEQQLQKTISSDASRQLHQSIREYVSTREKLFAEILDQDKKIEKLLHTMREAVVKEMKNLNRGKHMNNEYINKSLLSSGFIDITE
ncbi:flagellar protein FliT [candidate division KSB1 bacterium]